MNNEMKNDAAPVKLPTGERLVLSSSPHLSTGANLRRIMGGVLLALLPTVIASVWLFSWRALWLILLSALCCIAAELIWCLGAGKLWKTAFDGSAAVTGVLLALCLPVSTPYWVLPIGAVLAIWLGKQVYGGLGHNPFNPALVARVGLLIALPAIMTTWNTSRGMLKKSYPEREMFISADALTGATKRVKGGCRDAVTCATPLGVAGTKEKIYGSGEAAQQNFSDLTSDQLYWRYFIGDRAGSLGETCVPALLLGYIILVALNLINWRVPLLFVATVAAITGIVHAISPGVTPTALFHILNGGLLLGAIFMATDMVTSPITGSGCVIFAIGCGVVTAVIRIWGNYPEGVSFSILFMNALVPLLDRWCEIRPFGFVPKREEGRK